MPSISTLRRLAAATICLSSGLMLATCAHGSSRLSTMDRGIPPDTLVSIEPLFAETLVARSPIQGQVLAAHTGAPVAAAEARLLNGSSSVITDTAGRFTLDVPTSGTLELQVRHLGYLARHLVIRLDSLAPPDTLIIRLESWDHREEQRRTRMLAPTAVTPCRPGSQTSLDQAEQLRHFLRSTPNPYPSFAPALGLTPFVGSEPVHVIDRALCRRATRTINQHLAMPDRPTQVHLFRLGRAGYAAYDPSLRDGEWDVMFWFDARLRLLTSTQWF